MIARIDGCRSWVWRMSNLEREEVLEEILLTMKSMTSSKQDKDVKDKDDDEDVNDDMKKEDFLID